MASNPLATNPLALAEAKMRYTDRRQKVLAQNVANADTPGYRARDVTPFRTLMAKAGSRPAMAVTNAAHLRPSAESGGLRARVNRTQDETSPNGNAVSLDEQALRIAENDQQHQLAVSIYRSITGMFHTALGKT